jgi:hypothetical protein
MNLLEHYPLVINLVANHLHLKDRTRFRNLISKEVTEDAEDYDIHYDRDLSRSTCLLTIIKCDGCRNYVKYRCARHTECAVCCKLLCYNCALKVYVGNCPGCN